MAAALASHSQRPLIPPIYRKLSLTPEIDEKLVEELHKAGMDRQIRILRQGAKENQAYLDDLRAKVKGIKGFWAATLVFAFCILS